MTKYTDAAGGWTSSVFDAHGKPTTVTDSLGSSTTFTYDRTAEPRGYVTSVTDSVAGTISAVYGPDGQVTNQTLPGGVALAIDYDANRTPINRTYTRTSDGVTVAASDGVQNSAGQWISLTTPASSKTYGYDRLKRLTQVRDTTNGVACTARHSTYNNWAVSRIVDRSSG
ncbi:RHS repeat protein [Modestobacter lapidis]|nr:RHS repeat protein [Modestobacter lapidis]